jgi:uracil phosphoribosyltransferase
MIKELHYTTVEIETPLGIKKNGNLKSIGCLFHFTCRIALHMGFLNYFDQAENGFISAYRQHQ